MHKRRRSALIVNSHKGHSAVQAVEVQNHNLVSFCCGVEEGTSIYLSIAAHHIISSQSTLFVVYLARCEQPHDKTGSFAKSAVSHSSSACPYSFSVSFSLSLASLFSVRCILTDHGRVMGEEHGRDGYSHQHVSLGVHRGPPGHGNQAQVHALHARALGTLRRRRVARGTRLWCTACRIE